MIILFSSPKQHLRKDMQHSVSWSTSIKQVQPIPSSSVYQRNRYSRDQFRYSYLEHQKVRYRYKICTSQIFKLLKLAEFDSSFIISLYNFLFLSGNKNEGLTLLSNVHFNHRENCKAAYIFFPKIPTYIEQFNFLIPSDKEWLYFFSNLHAISELIFPLKYGF